MNRLKQLRDHFKIKTQTELADMLKLKRHTVVDIEGGKQKISVELAENIIEIFPNINFEWLLTGKGEMLIDGLSSNRKMQKVPVLEAFASAGGGALNEKENVLTYLFFDKNYLKQDLGASLEKLSIIKVIGDSMAPTILDGDLMLIDQTKTKPNKSGIYVLRIQDDCIIKRIILLPDNKLEITSDNKVYGSFIVNLENQQNIDIIGKVLLNIRRFH